MPEALFNTQVFEQDNLKITVLDIPAITEQIKTVIDNEICSICLGANQEDLQNVKRALKRRSQSWTDKQKMGNVAEFFIHLYMSLTGYKQEFLFFNLEENSLKKGFDGLYTIGEQHWIMESKSGTNTSHKSKVKEAFNDLKAKITTGIENNPWRNAYNHASHRDVGSAENLLNNLRVMARDFETGQYQSIDDKNIMPCATIFLDGAWTEQDHDAIIESIKNIEELSGQYIHVICVTQTSYQLFLQYLEE